MLAVVLLVALLADPPASQPAVPPKLWRAAFAYAETCRELRDRERSGLEYRIKVYQKTSESPFDRKRVKELEAELAAIDSKPIRGEFSKKYPPSVGRAGFLPILTVVQIWGDSTVLTSLDGIMIVVADIGTRNLVDGQHFSVDQPVFFPSTFQYKSVTGSTTALLAAPFDLEAAQRAVEAHEREVRNNIRRSLPPEAVPFNERPEYRTLQDAIDAATSKLDNANAKRGRYIEDDAEFKKLNARLSKLADDKAEAYGQRRLDLAGEWLKVKKQVDAMRIQAVATDPAVDEAERKLSLAINEMEAAKEAYSRNPTTRPAK